MILIGLTGGIASGKSSVSSVLEESGCPIIDADLIAREGVSFVKYIQPLATLYNYGVTINLCTLTIPGICHV